MATFGLFYSVMTAIVSDLWIMRYIRHWDWFQVFIFFFATFWIPFNLWREGSLPGSKLRGAIYTLILKSRIFWLNMIFSIGLFMLPYWLIRRYRVLFLEPRLYATV